jgi:serine/threonine-protein kinase ULK2
LQDRKIPPTPTIDDYPTDYPLNTNITFPPPPNTAAIPNVNTNVPPLSSSPSSIASRAASNALNRAISLASKKLFGSPRPSRGSPSHEYSEPSSPRRPPIISLDGGEVDRDPLEDELLAALEELAQKTDVLTHWADEMYEYVKAVPQSESFLHSIYV